jgi:hypothetical protein
MYQNQQAHSSTYMLRRLRVSEGKSSYRHCGAGGLDAFLLAIHYSGEKRVKCTAETFVNISGSKLFQQPVGALSKRGGVR